MVIGVEGVTAEDVAFVAPDERRLSSTVEAAVWARLPAALAAAFRARSRLTAGFEVRHATAGSSSTPWISEPYAAYPGLVAAVPWRATLSMSVAMEIAARIQCEARAGPVGGR